MGPVVRRDVPVGVPVAVRLEKPVELVARIISVGQLGLDEPEKLAVLFQVSVGQGRGPVFLRVSRFLHQLPHGADSVRVGDLERFRAHQVQEKRDGVEAALPMGQSLLPETEHLLGLELVAFGKFRPRLDDGKDGPAVGGRQAFPRPAAERPAKGLPERFDRDGFRLGKSAFPLLERLVRVFGEREPRQVLVDPFQNEGDDGAFGFFVEVDGHKHHTFSSFCDGLGGSLDATVRTVAFFGWNGG